MSDSPDTTPEQPTPAPQDILPPASEKFSGHIVKAAQEFIDTITPLIRDDRKAQASIRKLSGITSHLPPDQQKNWENRHPEYKSCDRIGLIADILSKDDGDDADPDFDPLAPYIDANNTLRKLQADVLMDWGTVLQSRAHEGEKVLIHHGAFEYPYIRRAIKKIFSMDASVRLDQLIEESPSREEHVLRDIGRDLFKVRDLIAQTETGQLRTQIAANETLWQQLAERVEGYFIRGEISEEEVVTYGNAGNALRRAIAKVAKVAEDLRGKNETLLERISDAKTLRGQLQRQVNQLTAANAEYTNPDSEYNQQLARKEGLSALATVLAQYARHREMQGEITVRDGYLVDAAQHLDRIEAEKQVLADDNTTYANKVRDLETKLAELRGARTAEDRLYTQRLTAYEREIDSLKSDKGTLADQLTTAVTERNAEADKVAERDNRIAELNAKVEATKDYDSVTADLAESKTLRKGFEKRYLDGRQEILTLTEMNAAFETKLRELGVDPQTLYTLETPPGNGSGGQA